MATSDPRKPLRADHRLIKKLYSSILAGKAEAVPEEFNLISDVFLRYGGSWVRLFHGSPADMAKLKEVIKAAFKKGLLTKHYTWEA